MSQVQLQLSHLPTGFYGFGPDGAAVNPPVSKTNKLDVPSSKGLFQNSHDFQVSVKFQTCLLSVRHHQVSLLKTFWER